MNEKPIIIIDDDDEDLELLKDAFKELKTENKIIVFNDGYKFLDFIKTSKNNAFFILCDINMQKMSGLELKRIVQEDEQLRLKCVPFIFLSTSGASESVLQAYSCSVQGYFVKPSSFEAIKNLMQFIITYWTHSQHPR